MLSLVPFPKEFDEESSDPVPLLPVPVVPSEVDGVVNLSAETIVATIAKNKAINTNEKSFILSLGRSLSRIGTDLMFNSFEIQLLWTFNRCSTSATRRKF